MTEDPTPHAVPGQPIREPISFTCDDTTLRKLARAGTVSSLASVRAAWPLAVVVGISALAMGFAEHTWVAGLVTAILVSAGLATAIHVRSTKVLRRGVGPGAVLSSGYDNHPRLVISTGAGATGLGAGSVRRVSRWGEVAVLDLRRRRLRLVTPSRLVTDADAAFLEGTGPAPARMDLTPDGPGPMPFAHVVTLEDQRQLQRTLTAVLVRRKAFWLVIAMEVTAMGAAIASRTWVLLWLGLTVVAIVAMSPLGIRRTIRQVFPVGHEIRAGLAADALLLDVSVATQRIPYDQIEEVRADRHTLLLALPMKRRLTLPRALLPDEAVTRLTAAVAAGRPSGRSAWD